MTEIVFDEHEAGMRDVRLQMYRKYRAGLRSNRFWRSPTAPTESRCRTANVADWPRRQKSSTNFR